MSTTGTVSLRTWSLWISHSQCSNPGSLLYPSQCGPSGSPWVSFTGTVCLRAQSVWINLSWSSNPAVLSPSQCSLWLSGPGADLGLHLVSHRAWSLWIGHSRSGNPASLLSPSQCSRLRLLGPSADLGLQDLMSPCPPLEQSPTERSQCEPVTAGQATQQPLSPWASVIYACQGPVQTWAFGILFHLVCPLLGQALTEHDQCESVTAGQATQHSLSPWTSVVYACQGPVLTWAFRISFRLVCHRARSLWISHSWCSNTALPLFPSQCSVRLSGPSRSRVTSSVLYWDSLS